MEKYFWRSLTNFGLPKTKLAPITSKSQKWRLVISSPGEWKSYPGIRCVMTPAYYICLLTPWSGVPHSIPIRSSVLNHLSMFIALGCLRLYVFAWDWRSYHLKFRKNRLYQSCRNQIVWINSVVVWAFFAKGFFFGANKRTSSAVISPSATILQTEIESESPSFEKTRLVTNSLH